MNIRIRYFGQIAEVVGKEEENRDVTDGSTLNELELDLKSTHKIENIYYQIALNQQMQEIKETVLNNNDEVAFMPPFAGG